MILKGMNINILRKNKNIRFFKDFCTIEVVGSIPDHFLQLTSLLNNLNNDVENSSHL